MTPPVKAIPSGDAVREARLVEQALADMLARHAFIGRVTKGDLRLAAEYGVRAALASPPYDRGRQDGIEEAAKVVEQMACIGSWGAIKRELLRDIAALALKPPEGANDFEARVRAAVRRKDSIDPPKGPTDANG